MRLNKNLAIVSGIAVFLVGLGAGVLISLLVFQASSVPESPVNAPEPAPAVDPANPDDLSDWQTYRNQEYGFELRYPKEASLRKLSETQTRIDLTFSPGTTLREKYLLIDTSPLEADCTGPFSFMRSQPRDTRTIDGIKFLQQVGTEGAAGTFRNYEVYSAGMENTCYSLNFVLQSFNAGAVENKVPEYNLEQERGIFNQILSTFRFLE